MSRIYFHSRDRDAEVRGSERAWFGSICGSLFVMSLETHLHEWNGKPSALRKLFPPDHYIQDYEVGQPFENRMRELLHYGMSDKLLIKGQEVPIFDAMLNTALRVGNDAVKLAARLHGQCEIHAWVEDKNRGWLAGIIGQGLKTGLYRRDQGWLDVLELLADSSVTGPFVTSYSVCEQFPNPGVIEDWGVDMDALCKNGGLELTPDGWDEFYFTDGWDGFKVGAYLDELK